MSLALASIHNGIFKGQQVDQNRLALTEFKKTIAGTSAQVNADGEKHVVLTVANLGLSPSLKAALGVNDDQQLKVFVSQFTSLKSLASSSSTSVDTLDASKSYVIVFNPAKDRFEIADDKTQTQSLPSQVSAPVLDAPLQVQHRSPLQGDVQGVPVRLLARQEVSSTGNIFVEIPTSAVKGSGILSGADINLPSGASLDADAARMRVRVGDTVQVQLQTVAVEQGVSIGVSPSTPATANKTFVPQGDYQVVKEGSDLVLRPIHQAQLTSSSEVVAPSQQQLVATSQAVNLAAFGVLQDAGAAFRMNALNELTEIRVPDSLKATYGNKDVIFIPNADYQALKEGREVSAKVSVLQAVPSPSVQASVAPAAQLGETQAKLTSTNSDAFLAALSQGHIGLDSNNNIRVVLTQTQAVAVFASLNAGKGSGVDALVGTLTAADGVVITLSKDRFASTTVDTPNGASKIVTVKPGVLDQPAQALAFDVSGVQAVVKGAQVESTSSASVQSDASLVLSASQSLPAVEAQD